MTGHTQEVLPVRCVCKGRQERSRQAGVRTTDAARVQRLDEPRRVRKNGALAPEAQSIHVGEMHQVRGACCGDIDDSVASSGHSRLAARANGSREPESEVKK
jgi:hypothetical protein